MTPASKTVLEVIQGSTGYLEKNGIESPRLNAEHLVAHVLGKKRLDLYLEFDRPLGEAELAPLRELIRRRGQGVPLQHLLGTVEFFGRTFAIDGRALIPRPETERLVEQILERPGRNGALPRVADVGTGSGVIALTLAAELPAAEVQASDTSADALDLARANAVQLGLQERVHFFEGDLLEPLGGSFDLIVANLPYIPTESLRTLQREVHHDPSAALDGGADGLAIISRLLAAARNRLNPGGFLALEIGFDQAERLVDKLTGEGYQDIETAADYQGINRFIFARYG